MCCGKKRAEVVQATPAQVAPKPEEKISSQPLLENDPSVYFQYLGKTALTLIGPISRRHYRFANPGAIVKIDPLDRRALTAVTVLRQVTQ